MCITLFITCLLFEFCLKGGGRSFYQLFINLSIKIAFYRQQNKIITQHRIFCKNTYTRHISIKMTTATKSLNSDIDVN